MKKFNAVRPPSPSVYCSSLLGNSCGSLTQR